MKSFSVSRIMSIFAVLKYLRGTRECRHTEVAFVVSASELRPIRATTASGNGNVPVACASSQSNAKCCPIFDTSV